MLAGFAFPDSLAITRQPELTRVVFQERLTLQAFKPLRNTE